MPFRTRLVETRPIHLRVTSPLPPRRGALRMCRAWPAVAGHSGSSPNGETHRSGPAPDSHRTSPDISAPMRSGRRRLTLMWFGN